MLDEESELDLVLRRQDGGMMKLKESLDQRKRHGKGRAEVRLQVTGMLMSRKEISLKQ